MARNAPSITSDGLSICNEHENEHEGIRTARHQQTTTKRAVRLYKRLHVHFVRSIDTLHG